MQFNSWDLGQQAAGAVVEISLSGSAANVLLLDSSNFSAYRSGHRYSYAGGYVTRSPVRLKVPNSGHWHIAIDYGGYAGRGRATVRVRARSLV